MKFYGYFFYLWLGLISVYAVENDIDDRKAAKEILTSFLESLKNGDLEQVYLQHCNKARTLLLADAYLRLDIMSRSNGPSSQKATEILLQFYNKDGAEIAIRNSKILLSKDEELLLRIKHIQKPDKLYKSWGLLEKAYDADNRHSAWLKKIASANDFEFVITEKSIVAKGKDNQDLKLEFINEAGKWKVEHGWKVTKNP